MNNLLQLSYTMSYFSPIYVQQTNVRLFTAQFGECLHGHWDVQLRQIDDDLELLTAMNKNFDEVLKDNENNIVTCLQIQTQQHALSDRMDKLGKYRLEVDFQAKIEAKADAERILHGLTCDEITNQFNNWVRYRNRMHTRSKERTLSREGGAIDATWVVERLPILRNTCVDALQRSNAVALREPAVAMKILDTSIFTVRTMLEQRRAVSYVEEDRVIPLGWVELSDVLETLLSAKRQHAATMIQRVVCKYLWDPSTTFAQRFFRRAALKHGTKL